MDTSQNYDEAEVASGTTLDKLRRERQKMRDNPVMDKYEDKISKKLGKKKNLMMDFVDASDNQDFSDNNSVGGEMPTQDDLDDEEAEILEAVERALEKKRKREVSASALATPVKLVDEMEELAKKMQKEQKETLKEDSEGNKEAVVVEKTTTGIGGAWEKNETVKADTYRPANGGWGYFPRPKDISKAYGGGKRIGAEVKTTYEDELRKQTDVEETREK